MLRIGLTGGIGCGKSTVLSALEALGAAVVDADQLAREVVAPGTDGLAAIVKRFGAEILTADGSLDRDRLAETVFTDEAARRDLEGITHPRIAGAMASRLATLEQAGTQRVVIEIPLLFESGMGAAFDATVTVRADEPIVYQRLRTRNGWSDEEIASRIASQMPVAEKAALATHVIDNSADLGSLRTRILEVWDDLAAHGPASE